MGADARIFFRREGGGVDDAIPIRQHGPLHGTSHRYRPASKNESPADSTFPVRNSTERRQCFFFARGGVVATVPAGMSDGVMVAQGPLEAFVMVRIHVGQPTIPTNSAG